MPEEKIPVNSVVELSVDPNHTAAFVSFTCPENGGADIIVDKIKKALADNNVTYGIL